MCRYVESTRIRLVSNPTYATGMLPAMSKMVSEEGVLGAFYSGFAPILCKQVPYTMTKFAVQVRLILWSRGGGGSFRFYDGHVDLNVISNLHVSNVVSYVVSSTLSAGVITNMIWRCQQHVFLTIFLNLCLTIVWWTLLDGHRRGEDLRVPRQDVQGDDVGREHLRVARVRRRRRCRRRHHLSPR